MITRVHIRRYKSLADVEVRLQRLSVLFGPNAAGKSNFLDALYLLSAIVTRRTLQDAFEPPHRGRALESFAFGAGGLEELLSQDEATFSIEVDLTLSDTTVEAVNRQVRDLRQQPTDEPAGGGHDQGSDPPPGGRRRPVEAVRDRLLRYRIEVAVSPKRSALLRVKDEYLAVLNRSGEPIKGRNALIELVDDAQGRRRLALRRGDKVGHPTYYDRYLDHSLLSVGHYAPQYPYVVAAQRELASWAFFYFEPRERMRLPNPIKEVRQVGSMGDELAAYLNTLRVEDERQFRAIESALHLVIPSVTGIRLVTTRMGEVELQLIEGGMPISARVVSEGTLRVLGLLALGGVKGAAPLLGFEEPENGVHPRRVGLIAARLQSITRSGQTQLVVTTHSPELVDRLPSCLYQVRKREGRTEVSPVPDPGLYERQARSDNLVALDDDHGDAAAGGSSDNDDGETVSDRLMWTDVNG